MHDEYRRWLLVKPCWGAGVTESDPGEKAFTWENSAGSSSLSAL